MLFQPDAAADDQCVKNILFIRFLPENNLRIHSQLNKYFTNEGRGFMDKCPRSDILIPLIIITITITSCANRHGFGAFSQITTSRPLSKHFRWTRIVDTYITGTDTYPIAIFALPKSYPTDNDSWKELQLDSSGLQELVTFMQLRLISCCLQIQSGFWVTTNTAHGSVCYIHIWGWCFRLSSKTDELKQDQERGNRGGWSGDPINKS